MEAGKSTKTGKRPKHDNAYKKIFSDKKKFLYFLKKYVKASWTADISLESMEKVNKSFITREYRHLDADLIYKQKRGDRDVYFYVLFELQSSVDYTMPFRLLRYMVELLNDIFKDIDKAARERKDFRLPAIVPIVLYNGDDSWTAVRSYREYTEDYETFGNNIIDFSYILFDLKRMDEKDFVPTKEFLDAAFFMDKVFDKNLTLEENVRRLADRLVFVAPDLPLSEKRKLARWIPGKWGVPPDPNLEKTISKSLIEEENNNMKHALEIMGEQFLARGEERQAIATAKKLLNDSKFCQAYADCLVDKIVEFTGLDLNTVLKMMA